MKKCRLIIVTIMSFMVMNLIGFSQEVGMNVYIGTGESGYKDGSRLESKFNIPYGIFMNEDGELIIVDSYNNRIRKVKDGKVITIAGFSEKLDAMGFPLGGYIDTDPLKSQFNKPKDGVVNSKGEIFITDTGNNVIRKISKGKVYTFAGTEVAGYKDGKNTEAQFNTPLGISIDKQDNIYVADSLNNVIRKITPKGEVSTFAGKYSLDGGYKEGLIKESMFNEPSDIAIDKKGNMYIADSGNQLIRKIEDGNVVTIAGSMGTVIHGTSYIQGGYKDGYGSDVKFNFPKGIDVADDGTIFVADTWNNKVRAIKSDGEVITIFNSNFNAPVDVLYNSGYLYVSDMWNNGIKRIDIDLNNLIELSNENEKLDEIQIWFNDKKVDVFDAKPYIEEGKTMVPIRSICEEFGATVSWNEKTEEIEVIKGDFYKKLKLNKDPFVIKNGRSFVHIRYLGEAMGFDVKWIPEEYKVDIKEKK